MTNRVLVVGDSHTRALKQALTGENREFDIRWLNLGKGASAIHGDTSSDEVVDLVKALMPNDLLVIGFIGAHHNGIGLLESSPPFDVFTRDETASDVEDGIELLPYSVARSLFKDKISGAHPTLDLIRYADCRSVCLMTPPPKGDNAFLTKRLSHRLNGQVVNRADRRRRLWQVERDVLTDEAQSRGSTLLCPPKETMTDDGFLAEPYWFNDAQHANAAYGALVLRQLRGVLG